MSCRALALLAFCGLAGCTDGTYVIGALCDPLSSCGGVGGGSAGNAGRAGGVVAGGGQAGDAQRGSLDLDLTGSGVERLPESLFGAAPAHLLLADDATTTSWLARVGTGFDVVAPAALALAEPGPFADPGRVLSHAGATTFNGDGSWADSSTGALAFELVFRAQPGAVLLSQRDGNGGVELALDAEGRLTFRLDSSEAEVVASSSALVADAWQHCLALFDAGQQVAQVLCNGQAGTAADAPAGFVVTGVVATATLGAARAPRVHWAELGSWQLAALGPRGSWTDVARERFARLVGTYADGAAEPLPFAEVRASGAYIDMSPSDAPELRRLHPVGEHWPRIVCRPTLDEPRTCGLLVEASSSRIVAPQNFTLDQWDSAGLMVGVASAPGPTGDDSLFDVTASTQSVEHALTFDAPFGEGPAVLSLFARAAGARRLRVEVVGVASATFDVAEASVVEDTDALVSSVENWGGGLVRVSFSFDVDAGNHTLRLGVLADDAQPIFAGDGNVSFELGDVDLRFRSVSTPLPTFGTIQQVDHLVYPASNGNLPTGPRFSVSAQIWLPPAPLLADAAIVNANFGARFDPQINLFVRPQDGALQFWGRQAGAGVWQSARPENLADGHVHEVSASLGPDGATLGVDGKSSTAAAGAFDITALDRIEVGISTSSSGPLTGIVRRLLISPPPN